MIYIIVGTIGSGKTVSFVNEILNRTHKFKNNKKPYRAFTNFRLKPPLSKHAHRIKLKDIVGEREERYFTPTGREGKRTIPVVNWEFWEKAKQKYSFDIFLDEFNSTANSRDSMSHVSKIISKWLFQIRKILGAGEENNIYIITQDIDQIDVNFRRLAHWIIECSKVRTSPNVVIKKSYYWGARAYYSDGLRGNTCNYKTVFVANPLFKHYDSYDLVKMSDADAGYL